MPGRGGPWLCDLRSRHRTTTLLLGADVLWGAMLLFYVWFAEWAFHMHSTDFHVWAGAALLAGIKTLGWLLVVTRPKSVE